LLLVFFSLPFESGAGRLTPFFGAAAPAAPAAGPLPLA